MAQVNFDALADYAARQNNDSTTTKSQVGFFSLKDDGDKAVVRFMHDSTSDFDVVSVHSITVDGKYRKVSCLKDTGHCPLCEAAVESKDKSQTKIFIHLIEYTRDEQGNVVAEPKVWERSLKYAYNLKDKIMNYGPLSDELFVVTRHGKAGDVNTDYGIDYATPKVYPRETYPKVEDAFKDYKALGTVVMNKTGEDMFTFMQTGFFPSKQVTSNETEYVTTPAYDRSVETPADSKPAAPASRPAPWETQTSTAPQRPVRSY